MNRFMHLANEEAKRGLLQNEGGPFGAVIVKDKEVIAVGNNLVTSTNDPTAHAEMVAIRKACKKLGTFDLSNCTIYSSCEPCPMCLSAIHWAKMKRLYYGCSAQDAADIGFDDKFIYDVIRGTASKEQVITKQIDRDDCMTAFNLWKHKKDKARY